MNHSRRSDTGRCRLDRILLINDEGIDAAGLKVSHEIASQFADEVWIVAPKTDQGGTSHAFSLDLPIRVSQEGPRQFAVTGTPSDCVVMATKSIMASRLPNLVISGVNRGANLADDIAYSGTVSGAAAAVLCGIPALAFSQACDEDDTVSWDAARRHGAGLLDRLLSAPLPADLCLNVNFPAIPAAQVTGFRATHQGRGSIHSIDIDTRVDLRGKPYYWLHLDRTGGLSDPDSDITALRESAVSVTPLRVDRTDELILQHLAERLE